MTPDEHAAEAENLLKQAARPGLDDAAVQALAQTAIGHNLSALLASRPTTPDNEPEPSAIHAKRIHELEAQLDENRRSAEEAWSRLHALSNEADDLRWLVGHLARNAPDTTMLPPRLASRVKKCMDSYEPSRFTLAEPVPSTGGDQVGNKSQANLTDAQFRALMDLVMVSDPTPLVDASDRALTGLLDAEAASRGFDSWNVAYHEFPPGPGPGVGLVPVPDEGSETDDGRPVPLSGWPYDDGSRD